MTYSNSYGIIIEVLRNSRKKTVRLAPLFDHGLSFICTCATEEAVHKFDVMRNGPVQCCAGSRSVLDNLKLIPKEKQPCLNSLKESDREILMYDLDGILPEAWQNKIWEMLWRRWTVYESIRNQE